MWNAVPSGAYTTESSMIACHMKCNNDCVQFAFNHNSGHCFLSTSATWSGSSSDHITSGCRGDKVDGCGSTPPAPTPTPPPTFDGVIRDVGDGRLDALLTPPFESSHASMVEQTADGRLHMGWFSGSKEGADGVAIVYSQLDSSAAAAGGKFSTAKVLSQRKGYSNQNAVLYAEDKTSTLHVFHSQQGAGAGESQATVWHLSSPVAADGTTGSFTKPTEVFTKPGSFNKNRVVERLDGSWLVPIYGQDKKPNYPKNELLKTGGDFDDASAYKIGAYGSGCDNLVQPTVIRPVENKPDLIAFFRDRNAKHIYKATSSDDGATWGSCKATVLPNNNAGIHAWQMRSGRIAMIYNPQTSGRDPLAISLSEDGGKTWPYTRIIETKTMSDSNGDEFSYPTLREDRFDDGKIHVSYTYLRQTIKYSMVSEQWIMKGSEETVV
jgi:predicted neuraminidase